MYFLLLGVIEYVLVLSNISAKSKNLIYLGLYLVFLYLNVVIWIELCIKTL